MNSSRITMFLKGMLGVFLFTIISVLYVGSAMANTLTITDADKKSSKIEGSDTIDFNTVMKALEGKEIKNGDKIKVNDEYDAVCEITFEKPSSKDISLMSVTSTYSSTCNVYLIHSGTNTCVATLSHSISLTYNDSGLVHINSGSISGTPLVSYVSAYAYGYTVTNTDGTYSYAAGVVRLYDSVDVDNGYFGCSVTVNRGSSPSFSFSQIS